MIILAAGAQLLSACQHARLALCHCVCAVLEDPPSQAP
jgi:hypothetical protein